MAGDGEVTDYGESEIKESNKFTAKYLFEKIFSLLKEGRKVPRHLVDDDVINTNVLVAFSSTIASFDPDLIDKDLSILDQFIYKKLKSKLLLSMPEEFNHYSKVDAKEMVLFYIRDMESCIINKDIGSIPKLWENPKLAFDPQESINLYEFFHSLCENIIKMDNAHPVSILLTSK